MSSTVNFMFYVSVLLRFNYLIQVDFGFPRFVTVNFDSFKV